MIDSIFSQKYGSKLLVNAAINHLNSCKVVELSLDASKIENVNASKLIHHITHLHLKGIDNEHSVKNVTKTIVKMGECAKKMNTLTLEGTSAFLFLGPTYASAPFYRVEANAHVELVTKHPNLKHIEYIVECNISKSDKNFLKSFLKQLETIETITIRSKKSKEKIKFK